MSRSIYNLDNTLFGNITFFSTENFLYFGEKPITRCLRFFCVIRQFVPLLPAGTGATVQNPSDFIHPWLSELKSGNI